MTIRRGEVYAYLPVLPRPGISLARLIISSEGLNSSPDLRVVLGLHVHDHDPGGLLAVRIGALGWASVLTIEVVLRSRLGELIGTATSEELDQVSAALRAAQDL